MEPIYLSTRAAAKLAGCEPHVLYASLKRHGSFCGVKPRRGAAGRLSWPANDLRELLLPPTDAQPSGMDQWLKFVAAVAPEVHTADAYNIGAALLGSEATPGWSPSPGQLMAARVNLDLILTGLCLQAAFERLDQAETLQRGPVADEAAVWVARIANRCVRHRLPTDIAGAESAE